MFRSHSVAVARAEQLARLEAVNAKCPRHSDEWFAESQILGLQADAELGLMDCYSGFDFDWLCGFYAGFEWNFAAQSRQIRLVLDDPRFPAIAEKIQAEFGFDLRAELETAEPESSRFAAEYA
jgi:hypothetical protein